MVMTTQEMIDNITAAGWRVQLTGPREDSHQWIAFALKDGPDGRMQSAKQVSSNESDNMAMRLLSNALGFPVPPGKFVPPLRTLMLSLRFAIEENIKARAK